MKKYDEAIENYKEIISINPNSSYATFRIAFCYEKKFDYGNSLDYYFKCIKEDPNMDKAFFRLSMFYRSKTIEMNIEKTIFVIDKSSGFLFVTLPVES